MILTLFKMVSLTKYALYGILCISFKVMFDIYHNNLLLQAENFIYFIQYECE